MTPWKRATPGGSWPSPSGSATRPTNGKGIHYEHQGNKRSKSGKHQRRKAEQMISKDPNVLIAELVQVCSHKTGQGYKLRALLYSLWNGKPASLLELVCLDGELRCKFLAVCMAFGSSDFFYNEIRRAFEGARLFDWFIEEGCSK
jgi:hypothetical protein